MPFLWLGCATALSAVYLAAETVQTQGWGFPLDDAWIHQVYARNLGTRLEFAFFPGQASAGSTSPLWALLLAAGYTLHVDNRFWALALGVGALGLSAWLSGRVSRYLGAGEVTAKLLVPAFLLFEWHLAWAALSGMEILLFVLISLALVEAFFADRGSAWLGALAGLLVLTRPEGALFGVLIASGLAARSFRRPQKYFRGFSAPQELVKLSFPLLSFGLIFGVLLSPYVAFNLATAGTILPNTFYAKSAEYASVLGRTDFLLRWLSLFRQPLTGAQILFLPGTAWLAWRLARSRRFEPLLPFAWILLLPAIYAVRLPVDYQYGRYEIPIVPFVVIYGCVGSVDLMSRMNNFVIRAAWALSTGAVLISFWWLGANQYVRSTAIINCEMVETARWTAAHLPPDALIAVHDIGAQGYFDAHRLLDLAGLVSPEVIPFIRDESALKDYMLQRGADYAIFFPDWYPQMAADKDFVPVHIESCAATHAAGGTDLVVYRIGLTPGP